MKVHLAIGDTRSLCGIKPAQGKDIRSLATFFQSSEPDQCERCLHHFAQRGYSIKKMRERAVSVPISRSMVVADRAAAFV